MKVHFQQSGGLVGVVKGADFDTAVLPPEQARELEKLVRASGITTSGEFFSNTVRDLHQYDIAIEDGKRKLSVTLDDASIPESARPLIAFLKKHAQARPPN